MHKNVNQYTKSGAAPARAAAHGETLSASPSCMMPCTQAVIGAPVTIVAPCEGTGYEIGSMSIIKGASNMDNAKKFYDWALTPEARRLPSPRNPIKCLPTRTPLFRRNRPKLDQIKLIDYDFAKYGSSAERTRLLKKWDAEVRNAPRN